jgi:hypothetical protein
MEESVGGHEGLDVMNLDMMEELWQNTKRHLDANKTDSET